MKNLILLLALVLLSSCDADSQTPVTPENVAHVTQTPVPAHMVGEYRAIEGHDYSSNKPYEQGAVSITLEAIEVSLSQHSYSLNLSDYATTSNLLEDCYYDIYVNGVVIRITDLVAKYGEIRIKIDGVTIAILKKVVDTPQEPEQPNTPVIIN